MRTHQLAVRTLQAAGRGKCTSGADRSRRKARETLNLTSLVTAGCSSAIRRHNLMDEEKPPPLCDPPWQWQK
ncbi:unnamed protein product [Soboliphyme baturini]|uniref:Uncharacterized protein n=1 Tax=Soboliphyme baturini TaxID=241478 RepID=A0A183IN06_9BILA|nr:unnamed protein product [Soboliphyme baturini]